MNRFWLSSILALSLGAAAQAAPYNFENVYQDRGSSYILVFAFPSASYLDWSSPSRLARTSVSSTLNKRLFARPTTIGHAQFAWQCRAADGTLLSNGASGQSGENNGQSLKALLAGWGMSILELVYTDGVLENSQEVAERIQKGARANQFAWAGFKVSSEQCLNLASYVNRYVESGNYTNYGFPVNPLQYEGAGCTSYAHAAVASSGAPIPFLQDWKREYLIPQDQMGYQAQTPPVTTVVPQAKIPRRAHSVSLGDFLFGEQSWASADDPDAVRFQYYDPELFYESFLHMENSYRKAQGIPVRPAVRTAQLDPFQKQLKQSTENWMQQLIRMDTPMRLSRIENYSGLIVDLRHEALLPDQ